MRTQREREESEKTLLDLNIFPQQDLDQRGHLDAAIHMILRKDNIIKLLEKEEEKVYQS